MNTFLEICLMHAALLGFQGITYLLIQKFEGRAHNIEGKIDKKIPFKTGWIYIYIMWFPLIAVFPIILGVYSRVLYSKYFICIIVDIILSLMVYYLYPTSFDRPKIDGKSFSSTITKFIRFCNYKGKNCMPSMHCSMCYIIFVFALVSGQLPIIVRCISMMLSVLIVISTVFTKQHVFIDTVAAIVPAFAGCIVSYLL